MADKYTSMSPYIYCAGNPVKLVDPDGENPVGGAILGAVVNGISAAVEGKSGSEIFAATVGGAVAGAFEGSVFFAANPKISDSLIGGRSAIKSTSINPPRKARKE